MQNLILNIETATTACSVCLAQGEGILALKEVNNGYSHSENLHVFINEVLKAAGAGPKDLSAVAVGKGPGSYTGLRIGVSAAKGLCYSLRVPLIGISTLQNMALNVSLEQDKKDALYCAMLDARRMEVYCAVYDASLREIMPVNAKIIDEQSILEFSKGKEIFFFGDGAEKCKGLIQQVAGSHFIAGKFPSAAGMVKLSNQAFVDKRFEDMAYFEPFYLKEFFTNSIKQ